MIGVILKLGNEFVEVRVDKNQVTFKEGASGTTTIDGLKLNRVGVVKEFPDLKDDLEWKKKAIERFKEKVKSYSTEGETIDYIISDLAKYGYTAQYIQKSGFRPIKC